MTRALAIALLLAACGGSPPRTTIENTAPGVRPGKATAGPGTARVEMRTMEGGVITLIGDREAAMTAASKEMAAHCGEGAYVITREGEEADGEEARWRIHYECAIDTMLPP